MQNLKNPGVAGYQNDNAILKFINQFELHTIFSHFKEVA